MSLLKKCGHFTNQHCYFFWKTELKVFTAFSLGRDGKWLEKDEGVLVVYKGGTISAIFRVANLTHTFQGKSFVNDSKKRANFNTPSESMNRSVFPYVAPRNVKSVLKPVSLKDGTDDTKVEKNAWISDGLLKPFELGLPIFGTIPPASDPNQPSPIDEMVNELVNRPNAKYLLQKCGDISDKDALRSLTDPESRSYAEKQFILQNSKDPNDFVNDNEIKFRLPNTNVSNRTTGRSIGTGKAIIKGGKKDREKPKYTTVIPPDAHLQTFGGAIPYFHSQIFADDFNPDDEKKNNDD